MASAVLRSSVARKMPIAANVERISHPAPIPLMISVADGHSTAASYAPAIA